MRTIVLMTAKEFVQEWEKEAGLPPLTAFERKINEIFIYLPGEKEHNDWVFEWDTLADKIGDDDD